jgi:hypothetical protein
MLSHVIINNASYYTTYIKRKFDDQLAIADYALRVAPQDIALDYHQQLLASFSIHAPGMTDNNCAPIDLYLIIYFM